MLLHESRNLVLRLEGSPTVLFAHWSGFTSGQGYQTNMMKVAEAVRTQNCPRCLANLREFFGHRRG